VHECYGKTVIGSRIVAPTSKDEVEICTWLA